uniref:Uncharacterized protein n=1 Tax=Molossus molossus TaxID=27622 RepID=A0A7J8J0H6_MOLMO|nr:hypothetical protein HJG59_010395 [Molossus molossus]
MRDCGTMEMSWEGLRLIRLGKSRRNELDINHYTSLGSLGLVQISSCTAPYPCPSRTSTGTIFKRFNQSGWCGSVVEHLPMHQEVASSIPGQGTCPDCGPNPHGGHAGGGQLMFSLINVSHSPSPFLFQIKKKKII